MAFDAHKNLAIATIVAPPSPSTSGTTLGVAVGEGARFPAAPFNATIWPATAPPTPVTAEVVRVTFADGGDGFVITRAQEGTTARAIAAGDLMAATITAKTITDLESGLNFPFISTGYVSAASGVSSNRGVTASTATDVWVTLITLPTAIGQVAVYLVAAGLAAGDAVNYGAFATVVADGQSARIVANNAAFLQIQLAGLAVQAKQQSGATQMITWSLLKVPSSNLLVALDDIDRGDLVPAED